MGKDQVLRNFVLRGPVPLHLGELSKASTLGMPYDSDARILGRHNISDRGHHQRNVNSKGHHPEVVQINANCLEILWLKTHTTPRASSLSTSPMFWTSFPVDQECNQ